MSEWQFVPKNCIIIVRVCSSQCFNHSLVWAWILERWSSMYQVFLMAVKKIYYCKINFLVKGFTSWNTPIISTSVFCLITALTSGFLTTFLQYKSIQGQANILGHPKWWSTWQVIICMVHTAGGPLVLHFLKLIFNRNPLRRVSDISDPSRTLL